MLNRLTIPVLTTTLAVMPVLVSCSANKTPLSTEQQVYAGKWVASDGTFVNVYLDGGGDFKISNSEVTGGKTTIADNNLTIALGPIKKEFKITQAPQEKNGQFVIQLDGITYTKQESSASNNAPSPASSSSVTTPSSDSGDKSQAAKSLENVISQAWQSNLGEQPDSLNCPNKFDIKAGNSINCDASVENIPFKIRVNFKDNQGNLNWEAKGLLVLAKVEDRIAQVIKDKDGIEVKATCGTAENKKYRAATPQDTFECQASDSKQNVKTVKIKVTDEEGTFQISSIN